MSTIGRCKWVILVLGMMGLAACTSSQPLPPEEEAGAPVETASLPPTDSAPLDSAELPPAPSDLPANDLAGLNGEQQAPAPEAQAPAVEPAPAPEQEIAMAQQQPLVEPAVQDAAPEPAQAPQAQGEAGTYTVGRGDTLMKVAYEVYGDLYQWKKLYQDNHDRIRDPNNLVVGTHLLVYPGAAGSGAGSGEKVKIKQGDTLGTIAQQVYGTPKKWRKLWENNKQLIHDPNRIYAGFYLFYEMTPKDQQELEKYRMASGQEGVPQASNQTTLPASVRNPASEKPQVYGPPAPPGYRTRHR